MSQANEKQVAQSSPVVVPGAQANQEVSIPAVVGAEVQLQFDPTTATVDRVDNSLVFSLDNGGKVTITDFFVTDGQSLPMLALPDGQVVPSEAVLAGLNGDMDLSTAAGPAARPPSSGGTSYEDGSGSLIGGTDRLGSLGTDFWGSSSGQQEEGLGTLETPGGTFAFGTTSDVGEAFGVSGGLYEDGMANQHTGNTDVAYGKLNFSFTGTGTTVVDSVTLTGFPVGTVIYIGNPESSVNSIVIGYEGQAVSLTYDQLTGAGVYLLPPPNSDADMNVSASVALRATSSGVTETVNGNFTIVVDAVADKPTDVQAEFVGGADQTVTENLLKGEEGQQVTINATAVFGGDADGADLGESHFVVVSGIPSQWSVASIPDGWVQITDETRLAGMGASEGDVVFEVSPDLFQGANASVNGELTFATNRWSSERSTDGINGDATLTVKGVAWEENPSDGELNPDNNIATTSSQDITVHFEESEPKITSKDLVLTVDETFGLQNDLQKQDIAVGSLTPDAQTVLAGLGLGSIPAVSATQHGFTFNLGIDVTTPELTEGSRGIALSSTQTGVFTASGKELTIETVDGVLQGYYMEGGTKHLAFVVFSSDSDFAAGNAKLTFVQYEALRHEIEGDPDDVLPIKVTVTVTDADGDPVSTSLTINVHDDGPVVVADSNSFIEASQTSVSGNVITGAGQTGGADSIGADGLKDVKFHDLQVSSGSLVNNNNGTYTYKNNDGTTAGTLTLGADGSYTFEKTSGIQNSFTLTSKYTATDNDGDSAESTLTINVTAAPLTVGLSGSAQAYESNANNTQGAGEYTLNVYSESGGASGWEIPDDITVAIKVSLGSAKLEDFDQTALQALDGYTVEYDNAGKAIGFTFTQTIKAGDADGKLTFKLPFNDDHITESDETYTVSIESVTGGTGVYVSEKAGATTVNTTLIDDGSVAHPKDGPVVGITIDGASSAAENSGTTFKFQVTLKDPHAPANDYSGFEGNNTLSQDMVLTLQVGGGATLGADYTLDFTSLNELQASGVLTYTDDGNGKITITLHGELDANGNPSGHTPFNMDDLGKLQVGATIINDMVTEANNESITMNVSTDGKNESTGGGSTTATIEGDRPAEYNGPFVEFGKADYGSVQEGDGKVNFTLELRDPADKTQPYVGTGLEQDIVVTIKIDFNDTFQAHDLKFYTQSGSLFTAKELDTAGLRGAGQLYVNIGDPDGDGEDNYEPITLQPATGTPTGFTFEATLPVGPNGDADGKYDLSLEVNDDPFGASGGQEYDKPSENIKLEIVGLEGSEARIGDVDNTKVTVTDDVPNTNELEGLKVGLHLATDEGVDYTNAEVNEGVNYRLYVDLTAKDPTTQQDSPFGTGNNPYANYTGNQLLPEDLVITIKLDTTAELGDDFTVSWNLPAGASVSGPNANGEYTLTLQGGTFKAEDADEVYATIGVKGDNINEHANADKYLDDNAADEQFSFTVTGVTGNESSVTDKVGANTTERTINDVADGKLTLSGGDFDKTHTEWGFVLKVGYAATEGNGGTQLPGETVHMQLKVSDTESMQHGEEYRVDAYSMFLSLNAGDADLQDFLNDNGIIDLASYNVWVSGKDLSTAAGDKGLIFVDGDDAGWAKGDSIVYDVYVPKDSWEADGTLNFNVDQGDHHGGRDGAGFTVELVNPYDKDGNGTSDAGKPNFDMKGEVVQVENKADVDVSDSIKVALSDGHTIVEGGTLGTGGTAVEQYTVQFSNANAATDGGAWTAAGDVMFDLTIKPKSADFDSNTGDNIGNGTVEDFALADSNGNPLDMGGGSYDLAAIDTSEKLATLSQQLFGDAYPDVQITGITQNGNNYVFAVKVSEGYDLSQGVTINFVAQDDRVTELSENFELTVTGLHSNNDLDFSMNKNSGTTTITDEGDAAKLNGFALALKEGGAFGYEKSETGVSVTVKAYILSNGVDGTGCADGQIISLDEMKALYAAETGNSFSGPDDAGFKDFVIEHFGPTQPVTLNFGFGDDSAERNKDYRTDETSFTRGPSGWNLVIDETTGEISFERNDINITTINDNLDEGTEQFDITLQSVSNNESRPVNGADGVTENTTTKAQIIDVHDGPVLLSFGLNGDSLIEPDRYDGVDGQRLHTVEYNLNLSKATSEPVTVWLNAGGEALLDEDYSFGEGVYTYQNNTWYTFTATGDMVASAAPAGFKEHRKKVVSALLLAQGNPAAP